MTPAPETGLFEPNSYVHPTNLSLPAADTARPLNSGEVEALREALDFVNETSGAALGLAMSGDNHPNPDGVLMDISRKGMDLAPRLFAALASAPSTPDGWRSMDSAPKNGARKIVSSIDIAVAIGQEVRRRNRVGLDGEKGSIAACCELAATELVLNALTSGGYTVLPAPAGRSALTEGEKR